MYDLRFSMLSSHRLVNSFIFLYLSGLIFIFSCFVKINGRGLEEDDSSVHFPFFKMDSLGGLGVDFGRLSKEFKKFRSYSCLGEAMLATTRFINAISSR